MDFPIAELMDEDACDSKSVESLYPAGIACPRRGRADAIAVHRPGPRNFPREFRGASRTYLYQYVAMFVWGDDAKRATTEFLRAMLGVESATKRPT